jgi:cation diffusion facilitator family transporter
LKDRSRRAPQEAERPIAVIAAFIGNALIMVTKGAAAILTGSGSLLAETAHSFADTLDQVFLYIGVQRSGAAANERFPLGFGKERYFWVLVVALMLFFGGGIFSLYETWHRFNSDRDLENVAIGFIVLGVSAVFEACSLTVAVREAHREASGKQLSLIDMLRNLPDPTLRTVLFEDSAALLGLAFATLGLLGTTLTGNHLFDAAGSGAIGILLIGVALTLAADARSLIIGQAPGPEVQDELRASLMTDSRIDEVMELFAVRIGVERLLVLARVSVLDRLPAGEVEHLIETQRNRLFDLRPDVAEVFLEVAPGTNGRSPDPAPTADTHPRSP